MKKFIAFLGIILIASALLACVSVQAEETTTPTTIPATETTDSLNTYYYSSTDNLIDQIYADVYRQIYDEVYAELSAEIEAGNQDEAIYAEVISKLETLIDSGELHVLVDEFQSHVDMVTAIAARSVVGVSNLDSTPPSMGSGVIYYYDTIAERYYLITNEHVVEGGTQYQIRFEDGSTVVATLHGVNADVDVAILSFSSVGLTNTPLVSHFGDSAHLVKGTVVLACGHPEGYDFYGSLTLGIISGLNRAVGTNDVDYIQIDAPINHGNSGGPLYNLQGEIIGINVLKMQSIDIEGMGFSIPIHQVIQVIEEIAPETLVE